MSVTTTPVGVVRTPQALSGMVCWRQHNPVVFVHSRGKRVVEMLCRPLQAVHAVCVCVLPWRLRCCSPTAIRRLLLYAKICRRAESKTYSSLVLCRYKRRETDALAQVCVQKHPRRTSFEQTWETIPVTCLSNLNAHEARYIVSFSVVIHFAVSCIGISARSQCGECAVCIRTGLCCCCSLPRTSCAVVLLSLVQRESSTAGA